MVAVLGDAGVPAEWWALEKPTKRSEGVAAQYARRVRNLVGWSAPSQNKQQSTTSKSGEVTAVAWKAG